MSHGNLTPPALSASPVKDAFAELRRTLFSQHPFIGNFDSAVALGDPKETKALRYRAQLHNDVRPSLSTVGDGKTDLLTWYTRIEFAPTPLLLSFYFYPSPSDVVAQGEHIAFLRAISRKHLPMDAERLFGMLGSSEYANSYLAFALPDTINAHGRIAVLNALRTRFAGTRDPILLTRLLELAAQHSLPVLSDDEILPFAAQWADERAVRHALWFYLTTRPLPLAVQHYLLEHLSGDNPLYDRLLVLEVLRGHGMPLKTLDAALDANPHPLLTAHLYPEPLPPAAFTLVQSMLMGQFARPGEGNSGGLGVFLSTLGSMLAQESDVERVVTVTLADESQLAAQPHLLEAVTSGHWVLTIPMPLAQEADQPAMLRHEFGIAWWARQMLTRYQLMPDVVHVRYADNGSLAITRAAKQIGAKVAFTVTPDPHRAMAARYMEQPLQTMKEHEALLFDLHKIFIADMLVREADGLIGISGRADAEHLTRYFPQLLTHSSHKGKPIKVIDEGVTLWERPADFTERGTALITRLYEAHPTLPRLIAAYATQPIMLNVGRYSPVKQQDTLVAAWLMSEAWRHFNLVLVGGNPAHPTHAEAEMLATIHKLLADHPEAAGRIALLPAMSNREVRLLEAALVQLAPAAIPHVYVCSSAKEEFGIAVLEAMDAGLLAVGPLRGGLASYLKDGENGYLIDTASVESFSNSLRALLQGAFQKGNRLHHVSVAGTQTVRERFDIRHVAATFAATYTALVQHTPTHP